MHEMDLIDTEELKAKLDRRDGFKVVMTLDEWEYRTTHIPGSIRVSTVEEALEALDPEDEKRKYCSVRCHTRTKVAAFRRRRAAEDARHIAP